MSRLASPFVRASPFLQRTRCYASVGGLHKMSGRWLSIPLPHRRPPESFRCLRTRAESTRLLDWMRETLGITGTEPARHLSPAARGRVRHVPDWWAEAVRHGGKDAPGMDGSQ